MRLIVHDYVGHAFQVQLSRQLASLGHEVLHLHCPDFETPKGPLQVRADDPPGLQIAPVEGEGQILKYSPMRRYLQERRYAERCIQRILSYGADVVLSGNAPPYLQNWLRSACQSNQIGFVAWMQDLYGVAVNAWLRRAVGRLSALSGFLCNRMEQSLVTRSDAVVFISEDFLPMFAAQRPGAQGPWHVAENWAPIEELEVGQKTNPWSLQRGLADKFVFLYSGTMGLKHDPELMVQLAIRFSSDPDVRVVVVTQGRGREYLEKRVVELGLSNLLLFDFQPVSMLADVLAAGDVLVSVIEKDAGEFSVPSKVLTYLCARRPLLLSVPAANLAAMIVTRAGGGLVVEPGDVDGFLNGAERLARDAHFSSRCAADARRFAQEAFDISRIGRRFEAILRDVVWRNHTRELVA